MVTNPQIIRVSAAVIEDAAGRLLLVRKAGTTAFMQPGGKPEPGETPTETLVRELGEELGVHVCVAALVPLGQYTELAANEPGFVVVADVFCVDIGDQVPVPDAEIEEMRWATQADAASIEIAPLAARYFLPGGPQFVPFHQQGCAYCRERWIYRSDHPEPIGEVDGVQFFRCARCGTFWELGFDYPRAVDRQRVEAMLGPQD